MIFCDGLILSQKHRAAPPLAGLRLLSYREAGDIGRDGAAVEQTDVVRDRAMWAWIKGSHETAIRVVSHEGQCAIAGNPGRWGRPDNVFGFDLFDCVGRASSIMESQGLPGFSVGEPVSMTGGAACPTGTETDALKWSGARVWSVHLTQNYVTGSPENARAVIEWLDRQSVSRVKKSRLGGSTVVWGSLNYCQTEAYIKADEMIAHAKGDEAKDAVKASAIYDWCYRNGVVRVEVKAAKDYLKHKGLTYLGAWDMGTVSRIYAERTEVLSRCRFDVEEFSLSDVPSAYRMTAAAWLRGEDVAGLFKSRSTLWRHAKALQAFGIDICERRNLAALPVRVRTIDLQAASVPSWYEWAA